MKKLLILTNIILLVVIAGMWYYCCRPSRACTTCCYPPDNGRAFVGLNAGLAKALISTYKQKQWGSYYTHNGSFVDARSVWFSINRLKRFIHEIENTTCNSCISPKPPLGVRIYYGTYPDTVTVNDWNKYGLTGVLKKIYANHHTVMMVPTYYNGTHDVDFDPRFMTKACQPMHMQQVFDTLINPTQKMMMVAPLDDSGDPADMANHGTLWPPPEPCAGEQTAGEADGASCPQ